MDDVELLLDLPRLVTVDAVREELMDGTETHPYLERALVELEAEIPVITPSSSAEKLEATLLETLDPGEAQALAVTEAVDGTIVTDDGDARTTAKQRTVNVTGSIGILVRAVENGLITATTADEYVNYPSLLPWRIRASVLEGGALMWTPGDQFSAVGR